MCHNLMSCCPRIFFKVLDIVAGGVVVSFSAFYAGGRGFDSHIHQS